MCLGLVSYGKDFRVKTALGDAFANVLDAKSKLWHGETKDALTKLTKLGDNVTDEALGLRLRGCMTIHRRKHC